MSGRKIIGSVLSLFSAFTLIVVILLTIIEMNAFDLNFYRSEFTKNHNAEVIGISDKELMQTTEGLLAYIKGERENLKMEAVIKGKKQQVFNEKEMAHMVDVQKLYATSHRVRNAGIVLFLLLLAALRWAAGPKFLKFWAGGYLSGAGAFFVFLGILALTISTNFYEFWNYFHTLFFTNDLWLLNPETDVLIQIVPEQFFLDLVIRILMFFFLILASLTVLSVIVLFKNKRRYGYQI
ncbi:MAG: TIGR01906 family membrane protein [Peptococcaceae bacterium]|nr:TIGR01906 family membrane protein [Peptococcaceae bacterium]